MLHSSGYTTEKMLVHEVHNLREAYAQGWDMQLDNRKGTKFFQFPRLLATGSCLDLYCISIRIETLKNRAAVKHTSSSEQRPAA